MIRVRRDRSNRPRGFATRARAWQRAFLEARARTPATTAAQFWKKIRPSLQTDAAALSAVFHGKCAYCESRMAHVQHPHIEHYRPKGRSEFEKFLFLWTNWLLSCGRCNDSKWRHFPMLGSLPCLLDPTVDDPEMFGKVSCVPTGTRRDLEVERTEAKRRKQIGTGHQGLNQNACRSS